MGRLGICAHMCLVSVVNRKPRDSEDDQKYVEKIMEKMQSAMLSGLRTVSYTHLTLPTILLV